MIVSKGCFYHKVESDVLTSITTITLTSEGKILELGELFDDED